MAIYPREKILGVFQEEISGNNFKMLYMTIWIDGKIYVSFLI